MSFDPESYPFGRSAVTTPENREQFEGLRDRLIAELAPINLIEAVLADELLHATWELERARKNGSPLNFANRAHRNWNRARKALAKVQSNSVGALNRFDVPMRDAAESTPLANPFAIPVPKPPKLAYKWMDFDSVRFLNSVKR